MVLLHRNRPGRAPFNAETTLDAPGLVFKYNGSQVESFGFFVQRLSFPYGDGIHFLPRNFFQVRVDLNLRNRGKVSRLLWKLLSTEIGVDRKGSLPAVGNHPYHVPGTGDKVSAGKDAPHIRLKRFRIDGSA